MKIKKCNPGKNKLKIRFSRIIKTNKEKVPTKKIKSNCIIKYTNILAKKIKNKIALIFMKSRKSSLN